MPTHREEMIEKLKTSGDGINAVRIDFFKRDYMNLKFPDPKKLARKFKKYFESVEFEKWSLTGLALSCHTTTGTLNNYLDRKEYTSVVEFARTMVEHSYELSLRKSGRSGDIFALKQFGWRDTSEKNVKHSGTVKTGINWIKCVPPPDSKGELKDITPLKQIEEAKNEVD